MFWITSKYDVFQRVLSVVVEDFDGIHKEDAIGVKLISSGNFVDESI